MRHFEHFCLLVWIFGVYLVSSWVFWKKLSKDKLTTTVYVAEQTFALILASILLFVLWEITK